LVAYELLRAVDERAAYANLLLPTLIARAGLDARDAALATELGYGALRASGVLDEIIAACANRPVAEVQPEVRDLLRLGGYQLLRTRIPAHAAVATTVDLARATGNGRAAGFVNAVLRRLSRDSWDGWADKLAGDGGPLRRMALRTGHPEWIAAAFAAALGDDSDGELAQTEAALAAGDTRPSTHLAVSPGLADRDAVLAEIRRASPAEPGPWSPHAVRLTGGDPARVAAVRDGRARVQDEGSQLVALAVARAPMDGRDERWLDLAAGPGGKAALLAALAGPRGAALTANEPNRSRAELVRQVTARWGTQVLVRDARELAAARAGEFDRVLLDAPCSGLGALRRRPEARWRRGPDDVAQLADLQRELLAAALRLVRPGGLVVYATCSPHPAETTEIVAGAVESGARAVDARPAFRGVPGLGDGPWVQLWPHRHGTDAMFCAILRRPGTLHAGGAV